MATTEKITQFNYIVKQLIEWYCEKKGFDESVKIEKFNSTNDFSLIKVIKLLFFVTTAEGEDSTFLDVHFSNYHALPYGPVEGEIYNYIKSKSHTIDLGSFAREKFNLKTLYLTNNPSNTDQIDNAISLLKSEAPHLIESKPFTLVDISHKRLSWQSAFSRAEQAGKASEPMSIHLMKTEKKYYV